MAARACLPTPLPSASSVEAYSDSRRRCRQGAGGIPKGPPFLPVHPSISPPLSHVPHEYVDALVGRSDASEGFLFSRSIGESLDGKVHRRRVSELIAGE